MYLGTSLISKVASAVSENACSMRTASRKHL